MHEALAEQFVDELTDRMSRLRVAPGDEPGAEVGPLIDEVQLKRVEALVDDAVERGAKVRCGGRRVDRPGWFYAPTVLSSVPPGARVLQEEVFGPVAPVVTFDTEDEALRLANDTPYGLVAYVYTRDLDRALRVGDLLETGMVAINRGIVADPGAPFGGVKHSGFGREGGAEGLQEYSRRSISRCAEPSAPIPDRAEGAPRADVAGAQRACCGR